MDIREVVDGNEGAYIAYEDGEQAGLIAYSIENKDTITLLHTEVEDKYRGQKVGHKILLHIVEDARRKHFRVVPLCPFTKHEFDTNDSLHDVLK